ncbi:hypothetical protein D0864_15993 [Hortaea werneckii]|nr:hypothetical protein D0864_15993 [Hortaea werneckii]
MAAEMPNAPLDRSPSPASAPPVASAPGPRAAALQKLYNDAINHVLKTCSYDNFAKCFPTPSREVPQSMRQLHEQFNEKLGNQLRSNFEDVLRDRNVVPSLNELDRLVEEAKRRKTRAQEEGVESSPMPNLRPHTLPAAQLYLAHLSPSLAQASQDIQQQQEVTQAENSELLDRVLQQRSEIATLVQGLENVVADLDASVATLKPEELDALREEGRDVDEEMRMVT